MGENYVPIAVDKQQLVHAAGARERYVEERRVIERFTGGKAGQLAVHLLTPEGDPLTNREIFRMQSADEVLTTLRDAEGGYPVVEHLRAVAADVRTILGEETAVSYGADWTEWFGHQPADGSGDVRFHLDPLWADPAISFVGIDWYPPLT